MRSRIIRIVRRTDRFYGAPRLGLPQYPDNLFVAESTLLHLLLLFEQNSSYVTSTFSGSGQDVVRHLFYDNQDVCPWYSTNMFLVTTGKTEKLSAKLAQISPANIILRRGVF